VTIRFKLTIGANPDQCQASCLDPRPEERGECMGTLGVESGIGLLRAILVEMGPTTEHEHAKRSKETRVTPPVAVGARVTPKVRPP